MNLLRHCFEQDVFPPQEHDSENGEQADCDAFARAMDYPIIPCDLCGSQEGLQRAQVKKLLDEWEVRSPGRRQVMFRSLMNVRPSHLADPGLFDFAGLARGMRTFSENLPQLRDAD